MGANDPHTPEGAAILFAKFGHTGFAFRQIIHEGERKFGRIGSVETFIPENGAPLAPTLPPRGLTAHAMPPHYLYGTLPTIIVFTKQKLRTPHRRPSGRRKAS